MRRPYVPYLLALGILYVIVSPILSVVVSVQLVERAQERNREASRAGTCQWLGQIVDAYSEQPLSPAGQNILGAWLDAYRLARCEPAR